MSTIYEQLSKVMNDLPAVGKDSRNQQGGYNFRGIDAVVNAVNPALRKHGVIVVPQLSSYEYGTVEVGQKRTQMGHARVVVDYIFFGPEGDSIRTSAPGEAFDSGDKATPKAMSVAFRTALLQALALPTDEPEADAHSYTRSERLPSRREMYGPGNNDEPPPAIDEATGEVRMIRKGQLIEIKQLEKQLGKDADDQRPARLAFYKWAGGREVGSSKELTEAEADMVIMELRKRVPADVQA